MDNKQILEEIDIIVRAKVENARKDIKKIAKETSEATKNISKSIKNIDAKSFDGIFSNLNSDELKAKIEEMSKLKKELSDKFRLNNSLFDENDSKKLDALVFKIREAKNVLESLNYESLDTGKINKETSITQNVSSKINLDDNISKQTLNGISNDVYSLQERLNDFDMLTLREQIKTVGMQVQQTFPIINGAVDEFKNRINDTGSLLGLLVSKLQPLKNVSEEVTGSIAKHFLNLKTKISSSFTNTFETVKAKVLPLKSVFSNIGKIAQNAFVQASVYIKEHAQQYTKPISKIKEFINKLKEAKNESSKKSNNGFVSGLSKSFSNGIKSIKRFTLSLLSIRTVFSAVSKAANAYLSFDTQLASSVQNCWNVLGSLLAPILEYIVGLFSKLVSVVATFVKALTGVDLVARANAKALDKQAKSAGKAGGSLSSIDDISVLNSESGGGSDTQSLTIEEIDMSPFNSFFAQVSELFSKIFEPFQLAWENVGTGVFDSIMTMVANIGELGSVVGNSLLEVWTNGTGQELIGNVILQWQQFFDIVGAVSGAISNAWQNAGTGTSIIQKIADIFKDIQKFVLLIGDSIKQWVMSESFQDALNRVFTCVDDIFGIAKDIANWLLEMYEKYVKPVIDDKLLPAIGDIISALSDVWNVALKPLVDLVVQCSKNIFEPLIKGLCDAIGGIIDVIRGVAKFISGAFTGDWKKAWEGVSLIFKGIWDSIWGALKGIINTMLTGFESFINSVIKGLNAILKPLRDMGNAILDLVGVNVKIPKISTINLPRLAGGDVAYEETAVVVGEYANARQDPEIISPRSMMEDAFRSVLNEKEESGTRVEKLVINVMDDNFYDGAIDYINSESARKGVSVIAEV